MAGIPEEFGPFSRVEADARSDPEQAVDQKQGPGEVGGDERVGFDLEGAEFPQFPVTRNYDELRAEFSSASLRDV